MSSSRSNEIKVFNFLFHACRPLFDKTLPHLAVTLCALAFRFLQWCLRNRFVRFYIFEFRSAHEIKPWDLQMFRLLNRMRDQVHPIIFIFALDLMTIGVLAVVFGIHCFVSIRVVVNLLVVDPNKLEWVVSDLLHL